MAILLFQLLMMTPALQSVSSGDEFRHLIIKLVAWSLLPWSHQRFVEVEESNVSKLFDITPFAHILSRNVAKRLFLCLKFLFIQLDGLNYFTKHVSYRILLYFFEIWTHIYKEYSNVFCLKNKISLKDKFLTLFWVFSNPITQAQTKIIIMTSMILYFLL